MRGHRSDLPFHAIALGAAFSVLAALLFFASAAHGQVSYSPDSRPRPGQDVTRNRNNAFTKAQRGVPITLAIVSSTITPNFDAANNFSVTLNAAGLTLANPSTTPVAGQSGIMEMIQDGTGSRTITTWGSSYTIAGGTTAITFTATASARDYFSYYVADSTHIVLSQGAANATH